MIGQTILQYHILEKLGEGGMGIVYKAEDVKLKRTVALKFLPHHVSVTPDEEARFLQEAQAAATLNHPNVCTIYDIKEHDKPQFIVMEYVDGVTLRTKLGGRSLKMSDALSYALQIGDALQEAHSKGIVHRDIKTDNIMVNTKNQIKVMDFGLAKLKGSLKLTRTSSTVGTLAYMAPEQIQGEEVDARSDIFSFGVVLYEMLAGRMPFEGAHEAAMMYSILNEDPVSLQKYVPDAPAELLHIFSRALEKDREDRYQTVHDMLIDLRRLKKESTKVSRGALSSMKPPVPTETSAAEVAVSEASKPRPTTSVTLTIPSFGKKWIAITAGIVGVALLAIAAYYFLLKSPADNGEKIPVAVADFVNQTNEPELDGLSGMLITAMEQSRRLIVLTRSHMFDVLKQMGKGDVTKIDESLGKEICRQANIGALVTASIRKFGKLYTIDLKVLDPQKNEYIFTAKEGGEGQESIPSMLDRLSEKTRLGLKEKAAEVTAAKANVANVTTTNLEAYQHFFQGEQHIDHLKFDEAEKEFRKAVELDSTFGLAWYRLTYTLNWNTATNYRAKEPLRKALSLIDRIPEKEQYLLRAVDAEQGGKFSQAVQILRDMEKIYPDDKEMIYNIGDWSFHAGDLATAKTYLEKVLQIDPTFERALQHLTWTYRDQSQYEKMIDVAKRYVAASGSTEAYQLLGQAFEFSGQFDAGLKAMMSARELYPKNYEITRSIARLYMFSGQGSQAESELKSLTQESKPLEAKRIGYGGLADYYSYHGRFRNALQSIDKRMEVSWSAKDTGLAAQDYLVKAWLLSDGWNDINKGWKEAEKSFPFRDKIKSQNYWGSISLMYIYHGDYEAADTIFKNIRFWHQALQSIRYSLQKDCANAELFADSAKSAGPSIVRRFTIPPLAWCQLEGGLYDKALASIMELRGLKEAAGTNSYVKSLFLAGKIYEKKGERKLAIESYEKFLDIWENADKDLPDYIDAKARLAKLKGVALR